MTGSTMRKLVNTGRRELSVHSSNRMMKLTTGAARTAATAGAISARAQRDAQEAHASSAPPTAAAQNPTAMRASENVLSVTLVDLGKEA